MATRIGTRHHISLLGESRMRRVIVIELCTVAALAAFTASACFGQREASSSANESGRPRVFSLPADSLMELRHDIGTSSAQGPAVARLKKDAEAAMQQAPLSVMDKGVTPPGGNKHDYMSMGPYWWPDPSKPKGLPYIRRDGEVNPETEQLPDHKSIQKITSVTHTLAVAYFLFGEERYAEHASKLLRVWYLDPQTRMNPNLEYGQGIPGHVDGRGTGLIDTRFVYRLVDSIGLLKGSKSWTSEDQKGMTEWCSQFLDWMLNSKNGKDEAAAKNNHGSYYDVQVVSLALFTGKLDVARSVLESVPARRIDVQIEPDGRQPLELERTKALGYSTMNLAGLFELALLGDNAGVDLWSYRSKDGRSIRKALDYLVPFVSGKQKWRYQQIVEYRSDEISPLLILASLKFKDSDYRDLALRIDPSVPERIEEAVFLQKTVR